MIGTNESPTSVYIMKDRSLKDITVRVDNNQLLPGWWTPGEIVMICDDKEKI